jgi:hypothetical protein
MGGRVLKPPLLGPNVEMRSNHRNLFVSSPTADTICNTEDGNSGQGQNVHHANEPSSREDGDYREIRRSSLCLAPLIHLLRGPHARIVRP